jgi:D-psicose/D-tagatose/L-ribulose 3-epimerase
MNNIGVHSLVWVTDWSDASCELAMRKTAETGFDAIEVFFLDPFTFNPKVTEAASRKNGLEVVTGMTGTLDADMSNPDPVIAKRGEDLVMKCISLTRDTGAKMLGSLTYSALNRYMHAPSEDARKRIAESYHRLGEAAGRAGIKLGLEPVNRYESNFVNTLAQAADVILRADSKHLFIQPDTYHINIEEYDIPAQIEKYGDLLGHVHIGENNRGHLGTGHFDFKSLFAALKRVQHQHPLIIESFAPHVLNSEFSAALALWQSPWSNVDVSARYNLDFVRAQLAATHPPG